MVQGLQARIPNARRGVDLAAAAPEASRTGPTPATLVYSSVLLTLDEIRPGKFRPGSSLQCEVETELSARWAGEPRVCKPAIALMVECLDDNPYARPNPDHVLVQIDRILTEGHVVTNTSSSLAGAVRVHRPPGPVDPTRSIVLAAVVMSIAAFGLAVLLLLALMFRAALRPEPSDVEGARTTAVSGRLSTSPLPDTPTSAHPTRPEPEPRVADEDAADAYALAQGPVPSAPPADPSAPSEAEPEPTPDAPPSEAAAPRAFRRFHDDLIDPWGRR